MSDVANNNGWSEVEVAAVLGADSDLDAARLVGITEAEAAALRVKKKPKRSGS